MSGLMAKHDAMERGFDTALLLDTQGFIAEGDAFAYFFVNEGKLYTPSLGKTLQSITRKSVPRQHRNQQRFDHKNHYEGSRTRLP